MTALKRIHFKLFFPQTTYAFSFVNYTVVVFFYYFYSPAVKFKGLYSVKLQRADNCINYFNSKLSNLSVMLLFY